MRRVIKLNSEPRFLAYSAIGGLNEGRGSLGSSFDFIDNTDSFGQKTWELAEAEMSRIALNIATEKAGISHKDLDLVVSGDLQNQCVASSIGLLPFGVPSLTVYGACSTCTESLLLASVMIEVGGAKTAAGVTTSHNLAAERQFRSPTEYGAQRAPTSTWTATAAGAFILTDSPDGRRTSEGIAVIEEVMIGRMIDGAITDGTNMGGAMAFAAEDTIRAYFETSGKRPQDFDLVITGDLGRIGTDVLKELLSKELPALVPRHTDCGMLLYDYNTQDCHAGASGCGTSASVLASHFLPLVESGKLKDILFLSTGALMSQSSLLQGNSISGIAPLIHISHRSREQWERDSKRRSLERAVTNDLGEPMKNETEKKIRTDEKLCR